MNLRNGIMKSSEFCNIKTDGEKASAVNMVFEMLLKGGSGDLEVDESLEIHNHLKPATVFALSTMVVNLGIVNHPYLVESYNNLIVKGTPPTEMGTAVFDNKAGNNTKKCAPSQQAWQNDFDNGRGTSYSISLGDKLADSYSVYLFNPFKQGDSAEGVLHITREQVLQLNPGWAGPNTPNNKTLHIGVNKEANIQPKNKYYSLIDFTASV